MASSVSGQDEPNRTLWLATRAGKMEPSCPLGTTRCIPQAKFNQKPFNKSFIDQVCSVKMAGYWPCSFFASLWTKEEKKKNLANIQPSWPHTWSITHTYWRLVGRKYIPYWAESRSDGAQYGIYFRPTPSIYNDNRTEWSPIRSVIIRVINKIGRPRSVSLIC